MAFYKGFIQLMDLYKINKKLLTTNIDPIWCKDAYIIYAPDNNVTTPKII